MLASCFCRQCRCTNQFRIPPPCMYFRSLSSVELCNLRIQTSCCCRCASWHLNFRHHRSVFHFYRHLQGIVPSCSTRSLSLEWLAALTILRSARSRASRQLEKASKSLRVVELSYFNPIDMTQNIYSCAGWDCKIAARLNYRWVQAGLSYFVFFRRAAYYLLLAARSRQANRANKIRPHDSVTKR